MPLLVGVCLHVAVKSFCHAESAFAIHLTGRLTESPSLWGAALIGTGLFVAYLRAPILERVDR